MSPSDTPQDDYLPVAELAVDAVRSEPNGFVLQGRGRDRADYRLELRLELPVDARTRTVLGELLAQSQWRISRRAANSLGPAVARRRRRSART